MVFRLLLILAMIAQPISAICCALCPPGDTACGSAEDVVTSGGCCGGEELAAATDAAGPCCQPIRTPSDPCPSRCCETTPTAPMTPPAAPARAPEPMPLPFVAGDAPGLGIGIVLDAGRLLPTRHERSEQHHHSPQAILCIWNN